MLDLNEASKFNDRMSYQKLQYLKLGVGRHRIRILPSPKNMKLPWSEFLRASNVGPNRQMVTPPSQYNKLAEDPLMEEISKLERLGDDASVKRAKALKARSVFPMFVIKRGEEAKGPMLWVASAKQVRQVLQYVLQPGAGDITSITDGRDIFVVGTMKPGNDGKSYPDYSFSLDLQTSALGDNSWILNEQGEVKDLFAAHKVGRPTEADLIRAILKGEEKAWWDAQRGKRQAERAEALAAEEEDSSGAPFDPGVSPETPEAPKKNDDAVQAKLAEIRARTSKGATTEPTSPVRKALSDMLS